MPILHRDQWMNVGIIAMGSRDFAAKIIYLRPSGEVIWEAVFSPRHGFVPGLPETIIGKYIVRLEWEEERDADPPS